MGEPTLSALALQLAEISHKLDLLLGALTDEEEPEEWPVVDLDGAEVGAARDQSQAL